jgi:hypothetical protein
MNTIPRKSEFSAPPSATGIGAFSLASGLAVLGALLFLVALFRHRQFFHDDTYISLRFARNLAEHGVLEWNLGERIEGYTNFLHVVLSAALIRLGVDPMSSARLVNVASVVALVWITWRTAGSLLPSAADALHRAIGL